MPERPLDMQARARLWLHQAARGGHWRSRAAEGAHPPALQVEGQEQGRGRAGGPGLPRERRVVPAAPAQLVVVVDQLRRTVRSHLALRPWEERHLMKAMTPIN